MDDKNTYGDDYFYSSPKRKGSSSDGRGEKDYAGSAFDRSDGGFKVNIPQQERFSERSSGHSAPAADSIDSQRIPKGRRLTDEPARRAQPVRAQQPRQAQEQTTSAGRQRAAVKKKRKRRKTVKGVLFALLSLFIIIVIAVGAMGVSLVSKLNIEPQGLKANEYISDSELMSDSGVKNILLLGSDARSEIQGSRSDTMILLSIDTVHKKLKMTSFLRDSYITIPSSGNRRKLNAAFSSGGAQLAKDTLEYNFKIKIDSYVMVDFEAFTAFIDAIGGVDIDGVTEREAEYLREKVKIVYAKEGKNHFSGAAALWYCRIRYLDNDFYRTQRQRKTISAVVNQATKTNPVVLYKAVEQVLPMISTSISTGEMLKLGANAVVRYLSYETLEHRVPADGTWSDELIPGVGEVLRMDMDENERLLKQFIYEN